MTVCVGVAIILLLVAVVLICQGMAELFMLWPWLWDVPREVYTGWIKEESH